MGKNIRSQKQDLELGLDCEKQLKDYLQKNEDITLMKARDNYSILDFKVKNQKKLVELKSRNFHMNKYNTTMLGYNKVDFGLKMMEKGYEVIIYFLFCDGLYKWKLNDDEIICTMPACRRDRGIFEIKDHSYIPINYLEFVTDKIKSKEILITNI